MTVKNFCWRMCAHRVEEPENRSCTTIRTRNHAKPAKKDVLGLLRALSVTEEHSSYNFYNNVCNETSDMYTDNSDEENETVVELNEDLWE